MRAFGLVRGGSGFPFRVSHRDADLVLAEPRLHECTNGFISLLAIFEDTDDGGALFGSGHGSSPGG